MRSTIIALASVAALIGGAPLAAAQDATTDLFQFLDGNGDGELEEAEIVHHVVLVFIGLDLNGDGVLSPDELVDQDPAAVAAADTDGDGQLTLEEATKNRLRSSTKPTRMATTASTSRRRNGPKAEGQIPRSKAGGLCP